MERSKLKSLIKRTVTALVLVPITISILLVGYPWVQIFAVAFGSMLAWEWAHMVPNQKSAFYAAVYAAVLGVAVMLGSFYGFFLVLAVATILVWFKSKGETYRKLLILGVPYIAIGVGSIIWLYELTGFLVTLWLLIVVWSVDIGGYLVGSTVKGPKLAPKISPNKTWSGLLGGVLLSVLASAAFCYLINADSNLVFYSVLAAVVAVLAQVGDLVESYIKRRLNVKDSSNLIPGHGGVFDRIDGLIFVAPLVFLLFRYALYFV